MWDITEITAEHAPSLFSQGPQIANRSLHLPSQKNHIFTGIQTAKLAIPRSITKPRLQNYNTPPLPPL